MRIGIIGDSSKSQAGNASWAKQFAEICQEKDNVIVEYIGESNFDHKHKLFPISIRSSISYETPADLNNIKSPVDVLLRQAYVARRLYEQMREKIYDAFIVQRMDYLPILLSMNIGSKIPIYVPNHDASTWENIIYKSNATTETPYRIVDLADKIYRTEANIISQSAFATAKFKEFNPNLHVETIPVPLNPNIEKAENIPFDQTKDILWVGAATSFKNPKLFMKIVEALPDYKFTAIFNTRSKAQVTKAKNKFKAPNLTILGNQPQEELIKLYQSHRLGIVTSNIETFCIVAQEKQLFMPTFVWSKSINQFHNVFPDLIPFDDVSEIVTMIKKYYNDDSFYTNKVSVSRNNTIQQYSLAKIKPLYFNFVDKLKQELLQKNNFINVNTLGAYIQSKLLVVPEYSWESALNHFKYNDNIMAQHSIFSQLHVLKKKDTRRGSFFIR